MYFTLTRRKNKTALELEFENPKENEYEFKTKDNIVFLSTLIIVLKKHLNVNFRNLTLKVV